MSSLAVQEQDLDVQRLVLDVTDRKVRGLDTRIENSLTGGEIERTLDGASTLTLNVHDPKNALLRSGIFDYQVEATLGERWRLVKVSKSGPDLTLTFEDRVVAVLRTFTKPRKAARSSMTRAEFVYSLVREAGSIPFHCPELHEHQSVAGTGDSRKVRKALPFQFRRGETAGTPEDSWACMQRLASDVAWRCFVNQGAIWYVSEPELLKAAPSMKLTSTSPEVTGLDFDVDYGKVSSEVTLSVRASRWAAGPGSVIALSEVGPADGLWLVHDARRGLYDADAQVMLKRATKAKPEPAPSAAPIPISSKGTAISTPATAHGNAAVSAALREAAMIDAQRYPYVWGGGHAQCGHPDGGTGRDPGIGYDCSGSTCAVLAAGGMGFHPGGPAAVSGTLASWGDAGPGQLLTIWANAIHVFMEFKTTTGWQHFGTGSWGKSWGGPGFNPELHPHAGFTPRHWPGT